MKRKDNSKPERKVLRNVDRTEKDPFLIPEEYSRIDPAQMEELQMPKDSVGYTIATSNATGIIVCFEVPEDTAMPFDSPESLVDILHGSMDDNQGIIEVRNGKCRNGGRFVYYIMKYMYGDGPVPTRTCGYQLNFNFEIGDKVFFMPDTLKEYLEALKASQEEARAVIGRKYSEEEHVLQWPDGTSYNPSYVTHRFKKVLKANRLPEIRFHDLRHTAGSILLNDGLSIKQIQNMLGHEKSSTTLDIYSHLSTTGKHETAQAMNRLLS